jgi:hypothetical protein
MLWNALISKDLNRLAEWLSMGFLRLTEYHYIKDSLNCHRGLKRLFKLIH